MPLASQASCWLSIMARAGSASGPAPKASSAWRDAAFFEDRVEIVVELLRAAEQASFEAEERGEIADAVAAIPVAANGHPFAPGAEAGGAAGSPWALGGGIVGAGAIAPAVVGGLMVVPDRDHRQAAVKLGEIRVETVGSVALAVVCASDDLVQRARGRVARRCRVVRRRA